MSQAIIKVKDLKVIYHKDKPNEVRSLDDVSLEIFPQEYIIIFGPSGCGKSTLLYSISGLQVPTEGEVEVIGKQLSQMKKKEMVSLHQSGIGMVFQAFYLIPSLTILDNVCLPKVFKGDGMKERKEAGTKLLSRFSIAQHSDKFPSQLSGGEKQRVSIARSLINNPELILADEPVGNLDSESAENVLNILKDLNEIDKKTVIMVTHNPEHLRFADRVIYMRDGKIIKEEVHKEKRPEKVIAQEKAAAEIPISNELRMLMKTFRSLSPQQIGALLTPYKADQLLSYILSDLNDEQVRSAGDFLKKLLFQNLDLADLSQKLNNQLDEGGAGWNKTRAESFTRRVSEILDQAANLKKGAVETSSRSAASYLENLFGLKLNEEKRALFVSFLELRIKDEIDRLGLKKKLDLPLKEGGLGLYKNTADKVSREMEMIKFINYEA